MRIQYLPAFPKHPLIEHVRPDVGRTLIAAGFAQEIRYKDFRERLAAEGAVGTDPSNTNVGIAAAEWGVIPSSISSFREDVVVKKIGTETIYFDAPPADAPLAIKKQWADLKGEDINANSRAIDKAKQEQVEREEREKVQKYAAAYSRR